MIFKATLSGQASPGYGQATIHFPIPDSDYDLVIRMLEDIGVGSPTAQDCRVVGLEGLYPTLKRLNGQAINVDELDYLAKRLDSFSDGEDAQFEAMAFKLNLSSIKDFINLTFCCQQATVITNFSDLVLCLRQSTTRLMAGWWPWICSKTKQERSPPTAWSMTTAWNWSRSTMGGISRHTSTIRL